MKALTALALLSGCNSVFGNDHVTASPLIDAQFFDAKLDAPPACAASGAPRFRPDLYDVETIDTCSSYSYAENGTVLAVCTTTEGKTVLEGGTLTIGLPMTAPVMPVPTDLQPQTLLAIRLAPEGDFALARTFDLTTLTAIHALRLVGGTWHDLGLATGFTGIGLISQPSRGPDRHVIEYADQSIIEHVGDGTVWTSGPESVADGFTSFNSDPGLTPDGLRLVMVGSSKAVSMAVPLYGTRDDIASPFTVSTPLDEPVSITQPFLTNDCDALFFLGLDRILYVKQ
jgi:hypothetical protein